MDRVQNLTQAYSQAPWRKQLQVIGLFLLAVIFSAMIASIYLIVTARAATIGREIQNLQTDSRKLEQQNADLRSRLAFITSAAEMERRALKMGFQPIETDETLFIIVPGYQERKPVILAPAPEPVPASIQITPAEYTESLFTWLQRQLMQSSLQLFEGQP